METVEPEGPGRNTAQNGAWPQRFFRLGSLGVLLTLFLVYGYSIYKGRLPLVGHADMGSRFLIAASYARNPGLGLNVSQSPMSWVGVWPPVPFLIQGTVLRLIGFTGMAEAEAGIWALQVTGVFFTLGAFYFVGRGVALQWGGAGGLLACGMCLCAIIPLYLAHSTLAEVFALFFVCCGLFHVLRLSLRQRGLVPCLLMFGLAFFCRSESIVVALAAGLFLMAADRWRPGIALSGTAVGLAVVKAAGAVLLVEGPKFWEYGLTYAGPVENRVRMATSFVKMLVRFNRPFLLVAGICVLLLMVLLAGTGAGTKLRAFLAAKEARNRIIQAPEVFWGWLLAAAVGSLMMEALRGNINDQWRYLYLANVLLTTLVAVLVVRLAGVLWSDLNRNRKRAAAAIVAILALFSTGSGLAHATGRRLASRMPAQTEEVIRHISGARHAGDRVAYDFLEWEECTLAAHLLNPSLKAPDQLTLEMDGVQQGRVEDEAVSRLLTERTKSEFVHGHLTAEGRTELIHAYIHGKQPRFLVIPGEALIQEDGVVKERPSHLARFLRRLESNPPQYVLLSPKVQENGAINFTPVLETKRFVVLERSGP